MQDQSPQVKKIEQLILQLEEEVHRLSSSQHAEIQQLRDANTDHLQHLQDAFEQRIKDVDGQFQARIADLEGEILYLKELNASQRLMMEDNLHYIKGLEKKLDLDSPPEEH